MYHGTTNGHFKNERRKKKKEKNFRENVFQETAALLSFFKLITHVSQVLLPSFSLFLLLLPLTHFRKKEKEKKERVIMSWKPLPVERIEILENQEVSFFFFLSFSFFPPPLFEREGGEKGINLTQN